jgi:hypothetical protein
MKSYCRQHDSPIPFRLRKHKGHLDYDVSKNVVQAEVINKIIVSITLLLDDVC